MGFAPVPALQCIAGESLNPSYALYPLQRSWYGYIGVLGDGNLMLRIEVEEETDGRFIAEVPELPGVMAYGQSRNEAIVKVEALALRVLADRVENGEPVPKFLQIFSAA